MKKIKSGEKLFTTAVCVDGVFYVVKETRKKTVVRLLAGCDNGKSGKFRFIRTAPLFIGNSGSSRLLTDYLNRANRDWSSYKPKKFASFDQVTNFLSEKKNIDPSQVSLRTFEDL